MPDPRAFKVKKRQYVSWRILVRWKDKHTFKDVWWQHRQAAERRETLEQLGKGGDCGIEPQGLGNSGGKGEQHGAEECGRKFFTFSG